MNVTNLFNRYDTTNNPTTTPGSNICPENHFVSNEHTCTPCPPGHTNDSGDNSNLGPTECDINICTLKMVGLLLVKNVLIMG